jgi:transcriptional regulator with PAS, ATPase and Fis domain
VVVDSTTIPENLLESELFGYEKGAFTGADKRKIGCIEMAHQGTLFLDEVGELTLPAQAKLLRALQEKMIRRVGGVQTIKSDFRLIAATNRDLAQEVAKGQFRDDLFYRLNVISLTLPPLRDRGEDSVSLAQHFIDSYSKKYKRSAFKLSSEQKASIKKYTWPGNIRELKNKVESAVILSGEDRLELELPSGKPMPANDPFADKPTLNEIQRRYIRHIIEYTNGRISGPEGGAIDILGMKRTSLYARMKALGMKR